MSEVALGPFVFEDHLGSGGMGKVFAGRHRPSGRPVALKTMRALTPHDQERRNFQREVEAVSALRHRGIVRVHDHGTLQHTYTLGSHHLEAGSPFVIMDRVVGRAMSHDMGWGWERLRTLANELLDVLAYAHARGIVHRDLKPSNILIEAHSDRAIVIDFGIAHLRGRQDKSSSGGTPAYMAPEQVEGFAHYGQGPWTDLFALGCMLFEQIAGHLPFVASTPWSTLAKKQLGDQAVLPGDQVPEGLRAWLDRLLQPDPASRFPCAAAAKAALADLAHVPDIAAARPQPSSLLTLTTLTVDAPLNGATATQAAPTPRPWMALPRRWQDLRAPQQDHAPLSGAGLGIFGLRALPMLGRYGERDALWAKLCALEPGTVETVMLRGFAGVGKSQLLRWLAQQAHAAAGIDTLWCKLRRRQSDIDALASAVSHHLDLVELEARHLAQARAEARLGQARLATSLMAICRPLEGVILHEEVAYRTLARAVATLATLGGRLIVVLDDIHHGTAVARWLEALREALGSSHAAVLIAMSARVEALQADEVQATTLERIEADLIEVVPLGEAEQTELVARALPLDGDAKRDLLGLTRGNPLHTLQVLGAWVMDDALEWSASGFRRNTAGRQRPAESIEAVYNQRLDNVLRKLDSTGAEAIIEGAALLGERLSWIEWDALCAPHDLASDGALELLVRCGLAERERGGWRFVHGLIHEHIESRCRDQGRWQSTHAQCAALARDVLAPTAPSWRRIAHHELEAQAWVAGLDAFERGMLDQSRAHCEQRTDDLSARLGDMQAHPEVAARLALCRFKIAMMAGALQTCARLLDEVARYDVDALGPRLAIARAEFLLCSARFDEGIAVVTEALDDLEPDETTRFERLTMLRQHGELLQWSERFEEALEAFAQAQALAGVRFPWQGAWVDYNVAGLYQDMHDAQASRPYIERAERTFAELGDDVGVASCALLRGGQAYHGGDLLEAQLWFDRAGALFESLGDAGHALALENGARVAVELRQFDRVASMLEALRGAEGRGELYATCFEDVAVALAAHRGDTQGVSRALEALTAGESSSLWAQDYVAATLEVARDEAESRGLDTAAIELQIEAIWSTLGRLPTR